MNDIKKILLILLFFSLSGILCHASGTSVNLISLKDKILSPQASLVFIVDINKNMFESQNIKVSAAVDVNNYSNLSEDEIKIKISEQPYKAEPYIQLSRRLQSQNNYKKSNQVLNIALPSNTEFE